MGCTSNGNFKFILKAYRECYSYSGAAAQYGATQTLHTTVPGFPSITLKRLIGWPKDISPVCNSNSTFPHIYCNNSSPMPSAAPNLGAVQEHIFTSDNSYPNGVPLTGVPPASGWSFYWGSCCRNPCSNIINSSILNWRLRAYMYPYNNQNVSTCFDNSPTFAEIPETVICSGSPFTYYQIAWDVEQDSLKYEWGQPLLSTGAPIVAYYAGFAYNNPLPDTTFNANNVAATMNQFTGEISFTSYTNGAFVTSIKVTAYKCGIKVAEIWRDMQVVLLSCGTNTNPNITPPFQNSVGQYTLYTDTVYAGEFISFNISATDFEFLTNGSPQTVELRASSNMFGSLITNTTPPSMNTISGCLNSPCATLFPAPAPGIHPLTGQFGMQTQFCWQTDCSHLYTNIGNGRTTNVYNFKFKVIDDYCPVPAFDYYTVIIVVNPLPALNPPIMISVATDSLTGNNTLNWTPTIDTSGIFNKYLIYSSTNANGPFMLLDSIDVLDTNFYVHLGANGTSILSYYYIKVKSFSCYKYESSLPSDTVVSSFGDVGVKDILNQKVKLFQNIPNPTNKSTTINYFLPKSGKVIFKVINIVGEIIYSREYKSNQGENKIKLDISNFKSGVYYYSLEFEGILKVRKMVVLR